LIGANHTGVIVTHVDKASKFLLAGLAKNKTVQQINQVTIKLFEMIGKGFRQTMTFDNGKEFSGHQNLAEDLGRSCFFANPYRSWGRGLNEHTNGLVRQFFPKGTNFKILKAELLQGTSKKRIKYPLNSKKGFPNLIREPTHSFDWK
jgi:transposase, IS30 family